MTWSFKRIYYGDRKILNRTRVNELIQASCLVEPYTIFDDWFRYVYIEGDISGIFQHIKKPIPDLLIAQKPKGSFAMHLSAGIDSSFLAFLYDQKGVDYLVGTVEGASDNEFVGAKEFVQLAKLKGRLHQVSISPQKALETANKILPQLKEPQMDPAVVLSYLVSQKAKELGHDLIVSGDGADIAFGDPMPFGAKALRTFGAFKTMEPAEMLGLKALLPYSHPEVQLWGANSLSYSQRAEKIFVKELARSLGFPEQILNRKKTGWVGHEAWCAGEVQEVMRQKILNSLFLKVLNEKNISGLHKYQKGSTSQAGRELIIRQYVLIIWLEANCPVEIEIIDGKPCNIFKRRKGDENLTRISRNYMSMSIKCIFQKILLCVRERRVSDFLKKYITLLLAKIYKKFYIFELKIKTFFYNFKQNCKNSNKRNKLLYVSSVGQNGKEYLSKIIKQFGYEDFNYLIFVYDDTKFDDEIFKRCNFVYESGFKWQFVRKYLTTERCKEYDYIFVWDDDIDAGEFSYKNFIEIMERNNLEIAQPALAHKSYFSHKITLADKGCSVGRYTDFVEVMVPVFRQDALYKFRGMLEVNSNTWGWGYDLLAKSCCKYRNMGIVDSELVTHTRPVRSQNSGGPHEMKTLLQKYKGYKIAEKISYGRLKEL